MKPALTAADKASPAELSQVWAATAAVIAPRTSNVRLVRRHPFRLFCALPAAADHCRW